MPNKDSNILKYNAGENHMNIQDVIFLEIECLLKKISTCGNDPEKLSTTRICKHASCGSSIFNYCSFDTTKNKLDYYRGKDFMKGLCKVLKEYAKRIMYRNKKRNDTFNR